MGYACPVCETPQRDGEHLANHLAFTAMLGDDAHEAWLAEHAPGWDQASPAELAERVVDHAEETEYEEVFEDTVDRGGNQHGRGRGHDHSEHSHPDPGSSAGHHPEQPPMSPDAARRQAEGSLDADAEQVLQQAREMTEQLLDSDEGSERDDSESEEDGAPPDESADDEGKDS